MLQQIKLFATRKNNSFFDCFMRLPCSISWLDLEAYPTLRAAFTSRIPSPVDRTILLYAIQSGRVNKFTFYRALYILDIEKEFGLFELQVQILEHGRQQQRDAVNSKKSIWMTLFALSSLPWQ